MKLRVTREKKKWAERLGESQGARIKMKGKSSQLDQ